MSYKQLEALVLRLFVGALLTYAVVHTVGVYHAVKAQSQALSQVLP